MTRTDLSKLVVLLAALLSRCGRAEARAEEDNNVVYHNQFAVHIPDGLDAANEVASNNGFQNLGQVSKQCVCMLCMYVCMVL